MTANRENALREAMRVSGDIARAVSEWQDEKAVPEDEFKHVEKSHGPPAQSDKGSMHPFDFGYHI